MRVALIKIINCLECPHSRIIPDPDLNDELKHDNVALICKNFGVNNPHFDLHSSQVANRQPFRCVAQSCRPDNVYNEARLPAWCPLLDTNLSEAASALRYLAEHERPCGGNDRYNSEHLYQIAKGLEKL